MMQYLRSIFKFVLKFKKCPFLKRTAFDKRYLFRYLNTHKIFAFETTFVFKRIRNLN